MPKFEFVGPDPIEHFTAGHVEPGDIVELDAPPPGPWKPATRKRRSTTEHDSDESVTPEEA